MQSILKSLKVYLRNHLKLIANEIYTVYFLNDQKSL